MSLIVWNLKEKEKKEDVRCMLYQITQICLNEAKMIVNGRIISFKLLLSSTCQESVITSTTWQMLQFG